jgi:hypothetical protein
VVLLVDDNAGTDLVQEMPEDVGDGYCAINRSHEREICLVALEMMGLSGTTTVFGRALAFVNESCSDP